MVLGWIVCRLSLTKSFICRGWKAIWCWRTTWFFSYDYLHTPHFTFHDLRACFHPHHDAVCHHDLKLRKSETKTTFHLSFRLFRTWWLVCDTFGRCQVTSAATRTCWFFCPRYQTYSPSRSCRSLIWKRYSGNCWEFQRKTSRCWWEFWRFAELNEENLVDLSAMAATSHDTSDAAFSISNPIKTVQAIQFNLIFHCVPENLKSS